MSITASNNVFPHDPDGNFLEKGGCVGTAKDLDDKINEIGYPDTFLKKTKPTKLGSVITINPLEFEWRLDQIEYTNPNLYNTTIVNATIGYKRIDILVATKYSNFVKIEGEESIGTALEPATPDGTLKAAFISISGEDITGIYMPDPLASFPPPFGTFKWILRGTDHDGEIPIAGDIFQGMISATEFSNSIIWNGIGELNNTNLSNFNILTSTEIIT